MTPTPPLPIASASPFVVRAFERLRSLVAEHGNEVSSDHERAMFALCEHAGTMLLAEKSQGRTRFALPCGMGKTTAVRSIVKAVHDLGMPHRIVIASSKVEELCRLHEELTITDRVSPDCIGLHHRSIPDPTGKKLGRSDYASKPAHNQDAQFLLVTHAHLRSGRLRGWMKECDLVLFDESLVVGKAECLPLTNRQSVATLDAELAVLERQAERDPTFAEAARTVRMLFDQLHAQSRSDPQEAVRVVQPHFLSAETVAACRAKLETIRDGDFSLTDQALEWAAQASRLRVFSDGAGCSLLSYAITVPDELQNVIVLDASDPIRDIVRHDNRMQRAEDVVLTLAPFRDLPCGLSSIKLHSRIQVYHCTDGGGRSSMTKACAGDMRALKKLVRLVLSKPKEAFLVATFKTRGVNGLDFEKEIARALHAAGIDPDAEVRPGVSRVNVLTWGRETGTNAFSEYENVVLLGVVQQRADFLASSYLGQVDDLQCPRMASIAADLVRSECHHAIYQAINRGCMRKVDVVDGLTQARRCNVYIWHKDDALESALRPVLRGCPPWRPWRDPGEDLRASDVEKMVAADLHKLIEAGRVRVSLRELKERIAPDVPSGTWRRGRDAALRRSRWVREGASLVLR